eukprot:gene5770-36395_t
MRETQTGTRIGEKSVMMVQTTCTTSLTIRATCRVTNHRAGAATKTAPATSSAARRCLGASRPGSEMSATPMMTAYGKKSVKTTSTARTT